jgi:hypothetical protein
MDEELAALAQMTGYKREGTANLQDKTSQPDAGESLLDETDLDELEASQTKTPIWSNPFAKGGFVAVLMALGFGSVGLFLLSVNHHWNQDTAQSSKSNAPIAVLPTQDMQQAEIGDLKTKEALGSQDQLLQQNARNNSAHILPQAQPKKMTSTPVAARPMPAMYTASPRSYSPAPRLPAPMPVARVAAPTVSSQVQPVDPQQAWQTAQALGSYGQTSTPVAFNQSDQSLSPTPATGSAPATTDDQSRYDTDAAALLSGTPSHPIEVAPGATAQAKLITPVIWAQDLKADSQPQKFDIQLSNPLYAPDGTVALPVGTKLVANVGTVSDSGLLELSVENAIVPTDTGEKIIAVPPGAIEISSDGGKPLMAENYRSDRGALLGHDIETTLLGALSEVGTLLNRPRNESTTTSPYLSSTSVSNSNTNLFGGVLQGGFGALQTSLSQRDQSQVQTILNRPHLWYIEAGKTVQVFVDSQFEARL